MSTTKQPLQFLKKPGFWVFLLGILLSFNVGKNVAPTWTTTKTALDVKKDTENRLFYMYKGKQKFIDNALIITASELSDQNIQTLNATKQSPTVKTDIVYEIVPNGNVQQVMFYELKASRHFGFWSLLPALVAILMCFLIREPLTALGSGIISGSFLLGQYDLTSVLVGSLMTKSAASIIVLYLLFLGALLGLWSKTGAAQAFADLMTKHFVKGPRSAKLVAWLLGVIFHQGGTMSTVLVGTTVKPLNDKEKVSHEELSYIVDSTASPIASILPFNAWPGYVQALIYVSGVSWLATETDRILFFFKSIPFSFYSIFAVLLTFLISIEKLPAYLINKDLRNAMERSRKTGQLNAPDAEPLAADELEKDHVVKGYTPSVLEFFIPIILIIGTAMTTYVTMGSPKVTWGFGIALVTLIVMALFRQMSIKDIISGVEDGLKGVVYGAIILIFAITIGSISKQSGGGAYLVELLSGQLPYWILPVLLQILTMVISFSTGTSWGTYAVTFPLAMPLAYAVSMAAGLGNPEFFMLICFTAVLNGSVFGDQCSPISDTTVLSAMCTGCDLMDHVKTQFYQALMAATAAAVLWTGLVIIFA